MVRADFVEVIVTYPSKEEARKAAKLLMEGLYAACVQIYGPVESTYWWKGKVESSPEWVLTAKTKRRVYKELERVIKRTHPYDVPQIIALPIIDGLKEYLDWIDREVR